MERISKGEQDIQKLENIENWILDTFNSLPQDFSIDDIQINYEKGDSNSSFTPEEDKFLAYCLYKYGFHNTHLILHEIWRTPKFAMNWKMHH